MREGERDGCVCVKEREDKKTSRKKQKQNAKNEKQVKKRRNETIIKTNTFTLLSLQHNMQHIN